MAALLATLGVAAFFTSALVAHRTLYESRPGARHLTEFYMWMSVGGVLGGVFAALIAPKIFSEVFEYPLLLALSFACRPGALDFSSGGDKPRVIAAWIARHIHVRRARDLSGCRGSRRRISSTSGASGSTPVVVLDLRRGEPRLLAPIRKRQLAAALLMFLAVVLLPSSVHRGEAQRSYFGVYRVILSDDGQFNVLQHGTTLHGAQRIRDERAIASPARRPHLLPSAEPDGAPRSASSAWRMRKRGKEGRFGDHRTGRRVARRATPPRARRGASSRSIPSVVSIAKSPHFTYLANCQPKADIVARRRAPDDRQGEGRELRSPDRRRVLVGRHPDAPADARGHPALRRRSSSRTGVGVLHISNRYLDLEAVLGADASPQCRTCKALVIEDPMPTTAMPSPARPSSCSARGCRRSTLPRRSGRAQHEGKHAQALDRRCLRYSGAVPVQIRQTAPQGRGRSGHGSPPGCAGRARPVREHETATSSAVPRARERNP